MKNLFILGRLWFDKANGNTYHSAEIFVDGEAVHQTEMSYGYGEQYIDSAAGWLEKNDYIQRKRYESGGKETLRRYCDRLNIQFAARAFDVKKSEL